MKKLSDKAVKALLAFLDVAGDYTRGERDSVNIHTEELNTLVGGPKVAFRDEVVLRECAEWCEENDLPLLTMMMSADPYGEFPDEMSSNLAFKFGIAPSRADRKKAWLAEREEIAALDVDAVSAAKDALDEAAQLMDDVKTTSNRRALANARNQEIEGKSLDYWLDRYQHEVLDFRAPGQPLVRNSFLLEEEGYKDTCWVAWHDGLELNSWDESMVGSEKIADKIQVSLSDNDANWITKRFGGIDLKAKLKEKSHGIERFERAALGFYAGSMADREFFDEAISLIGRQYPVITHLMFLKDKTVHVPVKPDAFEAGLRKLGIEFYLSGFCSWDNYTKFLGYLEHLRQKLLVNEPDVTLLDAHSILWIIGSGYWFEGEGAKSLEAQKIAAGND